MKKIAAILLFLLLPSFACAAEFVQQPIFLSKSPVTEGQKVRIYSIVSNNSNAAFTGNILIEEGGTQIGSASTSLAIDATQTISVPWKPTAGSHIITALLIADDGTTVQQVSQTFTILALPQPIASTTPDNSQINQSIQNNNTDYRPSTVIQNAVANISPTVATDTKPIFTIIDGARSNIANVLNNQIIQNRTNLAKNTSAAGSSASLSAAAINSSSTPFHIFLDAFWTVYLYFLIVLKLLIDNPVIFYPLAILIFFYVLWRIYKRISYRRRYNKLLEN